MYKLVLATALILLSLTLQAQDTEATTDTGLQIEVLTDNVINDHGKILIALYTKEGFYSRDPFMKTAVAIENGKATSVFKDVPPGTYAIMALHDENENYRMDMQSNGMPKEAWATSGNDLSMGPPDFESSKFELQKENLTINLRF